MGGVESNYSSPLRLGEKDSGGAMATVSSALARRAWILVKTWGRSTSFSGRIDGSGGPWGRQDF